MHKKIKHIIAASLVIGAVSGILPVNDFRIGITEVQAATYKDARNGELESLNLTWGSGSKIKLRESYSGEEVDLSDDTDYYVELKSIKSFNISADVKGSGYVVKVFDSASKSEKGEDIGEDVDINSTYKDIYLRTYKSEAAYEEAYDDGDVSECEETYIIHVKKSSVVSSEREDDREYAYLDNIHLSEGYINFSKDNTSYDVNVGEDVNKIVIRATPEDDENTVEIDGNVVYAEDDFEKAISLDKGNNTIDINVENAEEDTTYTLNIYRGNAPTSTTQNVTVQSEGNKTKTWQRIDGKWRYIDGLGQVLKNQWWFDQNSGMNYYLKEDGDRATGWFSNNNNWYYLNENGEMKTGWVNVNKNWYYLNQSGVMRMGWLEDSTGNWYYLDGSGAMDTGWITNADGKWYYLDSTGKMIKDSTINGEKVGADGAWVK